ncbi:GNAT family N-acetyltransferase [Paenibacillus sp. NPDC058174]|uniref:GNAT family N-acetyltransferase n=1 Tax=Paenibacillus sp. NPDC058174 TaxID=3346366 RepID=UPI0036DA0072
MMISQVVALKPITEQNRELCIGLKPREDQMNFVAPNLHSLEKAEAEPSSRPYGIYAGEMMVGFTLFDEEPYPEDGFYWIVRFMIDERYQGRGYGKAALNEIISKIRDGREQASIRISHVPQNVVVNKLYKDLGFIETGEIIGGEIVLDLLHR